MSSIKSICLITPGHLSSTPRLVREADTLIRHGYRVTVVAGRYYQPSIELDQSILQEAEWEYHGVEMAMMDRFNLKMLSWSSRLLKKLGLKLGLESEFTMHFPFSSVLLTRVNETAATADLYLGHCLPALYVAVEAARINGGESGFDIEDYHPEETHGSCDDPKRKAVTNSALKVWLPQCRHLTAASPLIAEKCIQEFHVTPQVVLNTYMLRDTPDNPQPASPTCSFYWFSQTIGSGRGLQEIIKVLSLMKTPSRLALRGLINETYRRELQGLAGSITLEILDPCAPGDVVGSCAGYQFGLSLEQSEPLNRDLCLTNKLFAYLLAGTPILCSPTKAQKEFVTELGAAALLIDIYDNPAKAAEKIDEVLLDQKQYQLMRKSAWDQGQSRYHWEHEERYFLASVKKCS